MKVGDDEEGRDGCMENRNGNWGVHIIREGEGKEEMIKNTRGGYRLFLRL